MAGQEGFEPTTRGFGIRCSSRWSYCPIFLLAFLVRSVFAAKLAEFFEFKLVRSLLLVLGGGIVFSLTFSTV